MMAMLPQMYSVNNPLIGGFIYGKVSLDYADMFSPVTNPAFSQEQGQAIARAINFDCTRVKSPVCSMNKNNSLNDRLLFIIAGRSYQ